MLDAQRYPYFVQQLLTMNVAGTRSPGVFEVGQCGSRWSNCRSIGCRHPTDRRGRNDHVHTDHTKPSVIMASPPSASNRLSTTTAKSGYPQLKYTSTSQALIGHEAAHEATVRTSSCKTKHLPVSSTKRVPSTQCIHALEPGSVTVAATCS